MPYKEDSTRYEFSNHAPASFMIALTLASWLPANGAGQMLLFGVLPGILLYGFSTRILRLSVLPTFLILGIVTSGAISLIWELPGLLPLNAVLSLVTYSSLALLAIVVRFNKHAYRQLILVTAWLAILELGVAGTQFIIANGSLVFTSMAAGDFAVGSLLTNSHLFVVKMLALMTVLSAAMLAGIRPKLAAAGAIAALIGALLGSALLATIAAAIGLLSIAVLFPAQLFGKRLSKAIRRYRALIFLGGFAGLLVFWATQGNNLNYIIRTVRTVRVSILDNIAADTGLGKLRSTGRTIRLLGDDAKVFLLGTGPGHYSSRAALILTGEYLYHHPDFIPISSSNYTSEHITPLWNRNVWTVQFRDGVTNQPFYGIQTLVAEGGLIVVMISLALYIWLWYATLRWEARESHELAIQFSAIAILALLPFLLLTDNWLEYPHAAIPLLLPVTLAVSMRQPHPVSYTETTS